MMKTAIDFSLNESFRIFVFKDYNNKKISKR